MIESMRQQTPSQKTLSTSFVHRNITQTDVGLSRVKDRIVTAATVVRGIQVSAIKYWLLKPFVNFVVDVAKP